MTDSSALLIDVQNTELFESAEFVGFAGRAQPCSCWKTCGALPWCSNYVTRWAEGRRGWKIDPKSTLQKAGKRRRPLWRQPFFLLVFIIFSIIFSFFFWLFSHIWCHARQFGCQILLSVKMSWLSIVYIYSRRGGRKPMLCMWRQLISYLDTVLTWMFIGCNVPDEQPKVRVPSQSQCHCPQPSPPTWKVSADEVKADGRAVLIFCATRSSKP